jgi:Ca-activated chloride channel family protein
LPLAALGFRRGWIGVVLIGVVGVQPMPAAALDWDGLWRTPDQRGHQAFESGDPAKAATQFTDPQWKAAALYRAGRYQEAGELLDGQESVTAHYNRGNALARSGLYRESVAAYDRALELDPKHEDARFNRELVRKQLPEPPSSAESKSPGEGTPEEDSEDSSGGVQQSASRQQGDQSDSGGRGRQLADASDGESGDGGSADSIPPSTEEGKTEAGDDSSKPDGSPGSPSGQAHRSSDRPQRPGEGGDASENESAEQERSMERMLSLVPDDPGELLRRKFLYQYRRAFGDEVVRGDAW